MRAQVFGLLLSKIGSFQIVSPVRAQSALMAARSPRMEIEYCPGCRWMLRSAWIAQELLSTFEEQIGEVALQPSQVAGTFEIRAEGTTVWERKADGGFPKAKVLKQKVRDVIAPKKDLGHSESAAAAGGPAVE